MISPAVATLSHPPSYFSAVISRLTQTAADLSAEASRGAHQPLMTWRTLIGSHDTQSPYPDVGRFRPWLQTAALMAQRSLLLVRKIADGTDLTMAEWASLLTASKAAQAGLALSTVLARRSGAIRPDRDPVFVRIDAMRWGRLHKRLHADIELPRREFSAAGALADWANTSAAPIRADSDGQAAIQTCLRDVLAYGDAWDVLALAERLAAGIEVKF